MDVDNVFLNCEYASNLVFRTGINDCKIENTPLESNVRFTPQDGTLLDNAYLYRKLVGSLIYPMFTRPDISYVVYLVSQFMASPGTTHYVVVLRIIRYIKGLMFYGLHYSDASSLILIAYSDVDWVGDPSDRRSTTSFSIFLRDSLISWRSKKQTLTARSSTKVQYRALADTTSEILWLRWLLADFGYLNLPRQSLL
ncbi:secreted RxLR effector protein 161-like [Lathyrus oleraceus]|uniref:secreted RxLR effector protein 161-like n=1 Tax=Pisum sativum TaxID=3888 RepID=UPI0021CF0F67|nr:secreted RxLR effector protein 161-like [Pisum sativum]